MNKYLYLFRGGDTSGKMSPEQLQKHMQKWGTWMADLKERKILIEGLPLANEGLVVNSGGEIISDGPFAEGKEVVGGYLIIQAQSADDAANYSKECPILEFESGTVEVRQLLSM